MLRRILSRWLAPVGQPLPLVLYTRANCPLCDVMKAQVARAATGTPIALKEVDIETDPELVRRYGRSIPVLEIAGRVAFKGRLTPAELERKLERGVRELESSR